MALKVYSLPVQCYRVAFGLTRSFSKASDIRYTVSKTFAYSTISEQTHLTWKHHRSLSFFQNQKQIGCNSFPNALSCRILHLTPNVSISENPNKARNSQSSESIRSDQENPQREKDKLETLEKEPDSAPADDQHATESADADVKPQSLLQRFKQTYKKYGKVAIGVHIFTSCIWATTFYYAAVSGVDVISLLKWLGASDKMIAPFSVPGVGHAAIAYLMYKLASPLRYMVTIGGTRSAVGILRRWGYFPPIPEKNRIRHLVKEGQQKMKAKYGDRKGKTD